MLITALVVMCTFVVGNFIGYGVHYALHCKWSGKMYESHLHHHTLIYPPHRFLSDEYIDPPKEAEQAVYYLVPTVIAVAPLLAWNVWHALAAAVTMLTLLRVNQYMHDSLHIRNHWLRRFRWFNWLTHVHRVHHDQVFRNLGIITFFPDKVLGTYVKPQQKI